MDFSFDVAHKTLVSVQNVHRGDAAWIGSEKKRNGKERESETICEKSKSPWNIFKWTPLSCERSM